LKSPESPTAPATAESSFDNSVWLRVYGSRGHADLGISGISGANQNQYGADVGGDRVFTLDSGSVFSVGAFAGYQVSRIHYSGVSGSGDVEAVDAGLYATLSTPTGWFVDGILKIQNFDVEYKSGGDRGEFSEFGVGASIEAGKRFNLRSGFFFELSAQLDYFHLLAETYSTDGGLRVAAEDSDVLRISEGVRVGRLFRTKTRGTVELSARAGAEHQFTQGGALRMVDTRFEPNTDGLRAVLGAGISWQFTDRQQLSFDYEGGIGEKYDRPWSLNASYRIRF
jgi:outer membrane autotransporter protein